MDSISTLFNATRQQIVELSGSESKLVKEFEENVAKIKERKQADQQTYEIIVAQAKAEYQKAQEQTNLALETLKSEFEETLVKAGLKGEKIDRMSQLAGLANVAITASLNKVGEIKNGINDRIDGKVSLKKYSGNAMDKGRSALKEILG